MTKECPKFVFKDITIEQRDLIARTDEEARRFINYIYIELPACIHTEKAIAHLKQAIKQCNASILFHPPRHKEKRAYTKRK